MTAAKPHYLLFCDGNYPANEQALAGASRVASSGTTSRWRFILENLESGTKFEASDKETGAPADRTALMAVLRGLEALEQPSRVTLVTTSRYVFRGLQYGLTEWRDNDYSWEHFGSVQPIRNADLWRRIDRTLMYHQVQCRWMSQDETTDEDRGDSVNPGKSEGESQLANEQVGDREGTPSSQTEQYVQPKSISRSVKSFDRQAEDFDAPNRGVPDAGTDRHNPVVSGSLGSKRQVVTIANSTSPVAVLGSKKGETEWSKIVSNSPIFRDSNPYCNEFPEVNSNGSQTSNVDRPSIPTAAFDTASDTSAENSKVLKSGCISSLAKNEGYCEPCGLTKPRILHILFAPIRWISRGIAAAWTAILRLDELLESYLRCLVLLDPRVRRRPPR